ncbi:hypothetical protein BGZ83_010184 [Gryganskiella cystojenkinii]|nr:hypothetical protein BGZ83_010184 [Gryganskiella cystojenkinii]
MPEVTKAYDLAKASGNPVSVANLRVTEDDSDPNYHVVFVQNLLEDPMTGATVRFSNWGNGTYDATIGNIDSGKVGSAFVSSDFVSTTAHCLLLADNVRLTERDRSAIHEL